LKQFSGEDTSTLVMTPEEEELLEKVSGEVTMFDFGGPLSFGAAADVGHQVRERVKHKTTAIILDFSRVPFVDVSAARAVETIIRDAHDVGKIVYETGMNVSVRKTLTALNSIRNLPVDATYETRVEALRAAVERIMSNRNGTHASPGEPAPEAA
jgi:SulP family sulfate permease